MKLFLLLAACLSTVAISQAQTTPAGSSSAGTPAVSGTKNVGSDRADAPKAPGMSSSVPSRTTPARARKGDNRRSSTKPAKAPGMSSSVPSRTTPARARKGDNRRSSTKPAKAAAPAPAQ